jgi:hypothetical protein
MALQHNLCETLQHRFTFRLRPESVLGDLRPQWRISVILLMLLRCGRNESMSLKKALVINWAVLTKEARTTLLRMLTGSRQLSDIPVRFDPALNRALDFARAEGVLYVEKKTTGSIIKLLPKGSAIAQRLYQAQDCLEVEKTFFNSLRGKLPEEKVRELLEWETTL